MMLLVALGKQEQEGVSRGEGKVSYHLLHFLEIVRISRSGTGWIWERILIAYLKLCVHISKYKLGPLEK